MLNATFIEHLKNFLKMITNQERKKNPELRIAIQDLLFAMEQCR